MAERIRFGILGCGVIGPHHARTIAGLPDDAAPVAVADQHADGAAKLVQNHGVEAYAP